MLLIAEKRVRGGICDAIYQYAKADTKKMKSIDSRETYAYGTSEDLVR